MKFSDPMNLILNSRHSNRIPKTP